MIKSQPKRGGIYYALLTQITLGVTACTPAHLDLQLRPAEAITKVRGRLQTRQIPVDLASQSQRHIRTPMVCFVDADRFGFSWDRAFGRLGRGPITFTVTGSEKEQLQARQTCTYQFRVTIRAHELKEGARLIADVGWWRIKALECQQDSANLLGHQRCRYSYHGTRAPRDIKPFIYGLLRDLSR